MIEVARWRTLRVPRVPRSKDRIIAGVAAAWANRWRMEPTVLRCCLGLLSLVGGIGLGIYAVMILLSTGPSDGGSGRRRVDDPASAPSIIQRRHAAAGCATAAVLIAARGVGLWPGDGVMAPAAAVAAGIAVVWSIGRGPTTSIAGTWMARLVQAVAGLGLLGAGVISLAQRTGGLGDVGASAAAIAVVIGGLAMFAAPAVGRMLRMLDEERSLRIREDERAAVAAHLHDSVLQSLVLIQRNDDPRRMANLARRQERELRAWLYGSARSGEAATVAAAIEQLTVEIETDHDVRVEAVVVGDQPLDDAARALVAAIREALVNAARHAGVERVDVFVEADDTELTGYVRDTGCGFEPGRIDTDRRGISDSIIGRVQRAGGTAVIVSEPAAGTEVELRVPRKSR